MLLKMMLEELQLIEKQIGQLDQEMASLLSQHQEAVKRLAEVPGLGVDSAQQIIAEVGATAATFPSEKQLSSWVGTCPGDEESAPGRRDPSLAGQLVKGRDGHVRGLILAPIGLNHMYWGISGAMDSVLKPATCHKRVLPGAAKMRQCSSCFSIWKEGANENRTSDVFRPGRRRGPAGRCGASCHENPVDRLQAGEHGAVRLFRL